jgi:hypothetical protein
MAGSVMASASAATASDAAICEYPSAFRKAPLASRYNAVTATVPKMSARLILRAGFLTSAATYAISFHPPKVYKTRIKASGIAGGNPCACPSVKTMEDKSGCCAGDEDKSPATMITSRPATLMTVNRFCVHLLCRTPRMLMILRMMMAVAA